MIRTYYLLTKPGIIMGNLMTTSAGFLLGSQGRVDLWLFLMTMLGLGCVIASACVVNNCIDRHADVKMERTKHRALARGIISVRAAVCFALLLGI
ncbi:MAG: UbiA family prenyltransferase, partial [Chlamydiales bacterium]|nr:UbiA family prenyltransferase [Chlamydiales bacterium]